MVDLCQALIRITFMPVCLVFIRVFELSDTPKGHLSPDMSIRVVAVFCCQGAQTGAYCSKHKGLCAFLWTSTAALETTHEGYTVK